MLLGAVCFACVKYIDLCKLTCTVIEQNIRRAVTLTVFFKDEHQTDGDLHDLGRHHGRGGQVARALRLQGSRVAHDEHQGRGLEYQHSQGEVLEPGGSHDGHSARRLTGEKKRTMMKKCHARWRNSTQLYLKSMRTHYYVYFSHSKAFLSPPPPSIIHSSLAPCSHYSGDFEVNELVGIYISYTVS